MNRSEEIELKLEIGPADIEVLRAMPLLAQRPGAPERQISRYFDTPSGELRKAGYSLRIREKEGRRVQTLKHRRSDAGGFSNRAEWESTIEDATLDFAALKSTPVAKLLGKGAMRKGLEPVSETHVLRTVWNLKRGGSDIELVLDEGKVVASGKTEPLCEVELELKAGDRRDLFALACEIGRTVTLRMGVISKSERGFRLIEGRKRRVSKAQSIRLSSDMSGADAFAAIVQSCLRHFRLNEPLLGPGHNPAALHQARVAIRRLRSAFSLFRPILGTGEHDRFKAELRGLGALFGPARNLDVLLTSRTSLPEPDANARRPLRRDRDAAYATVRETLAGDDVPQLILDLVAWAEAGKWRSDPDAQAPLGPFAAARLDRAWKRVRRLRASLEEGDAEARHTVRIELKKLRYATEFFRGLVPKPRRKAAAAFLKRLRRLQELLGDANDIATARDMLPEAGDTSTGADGRTAGLVSDAVRELDALHQRSLLAIAGL